MYITLEGPEATGKSSQAQILYDKLVELYPDRKIVLTKEPGTKLDPVCQQIREVLLDPKNEINDKTALLLFLADRSQHIKSVVRPTLAEGGIIISDRSSLSTVVYHAAKILVSGVDEADTAHLYEMVDFAQGIAPDICFVANADFDWCEKKLGERDGLDRIEGFGEAFHKKIHELFNEVATQALPFSNAYTFGIRERMRSFPKKIHLLPSSSSHTLEDISSFILEKLG